MNISNLFGNTILSIALAFQNTADSNRIFIEMDNFVGSHTLTYKQDVQRTTAISAWSGLVWSGGVIRSPPLECVVQGMLSVDIGEI